MVWRGSRRGYKTDALQGDVLTKTFTHLSPRPFIPFHPYSVFTMSKLRPFFTLLALSLSYAPAFAAIGPVADLTISNGDVTPDGFTRAAVLVNGVLPGPLVTGDKVRVTIAQVCSTRLQHGDV